MFDLDTIQKFFGAFGHWFVMGASALWTYLRTQDRDNSADIKAVSKDVAEFKVVVRQENEGQNTRINALEFAVKALPTASEFSKLSADAAATRAQLNGIADLLKRVEHQTDLIQQHLLQGKK